LRANEALQINSRMPEKVLVRERAIATAGFANEVEAVNKRARVYF
jgi:hypothetical protein